MGAPTALRTAPVTIDGGCVYCDNQNNFLCDVTFRNGGVFENASALRIGGGGDSCKFATVRSEGSGTNEIRGMLRFYRYEGGSDKESQAIVFDVGARPRLTGAAAACQGQRDGVQYGPGSGV